MKPEDIDVTTLRLLRYRVCSYNCHVVDTNVLLYERFYLGVATNGRHGFTRAEAEDLKALERYM